jgi:excisionase family DNA binding protein
MLGDCPMTERLAYSVSDAGRAIGVGVTKLYQLIGSGQIEARKAGGKTLIPAESLRAYLESLPRADIRTGQAKAAA